MGVTGLFPLFESKGGPECYKMVSIEAFKDLTIAIDMGPLLYKLAYGRTGDHLARLHKLVQLLRKNKIKTYWIVDGVHPELKAREHEKRSENRAKVEENTLHLQTVLQQMKVEAGFFDKISIFKQKALNEKEKVEWDRIARLELQLGKRRNQKVRVDAQLIQECIDFLLKNEEKVLYAEHEGEAMCAVLNRLGLVDCCFSDDADALPFGAISVCRYFTPSYIEGTLTLKLYPNIPETLKTFGYSPEMLVNLCCILPNDFNQGTRVQRVSVEAAFEELKTVDLIEFMESWCEQKDKIWTPEMVTNYNAVKSLFFGEHQKKIEDLSLEIRQQFKESENNPHTLVAALWTIDESISVPLAEDAAVVEDVRKHLFDGKPTKRIKFENGKWSLIPQPQQKSDQMELGEDESVLKYWIEEEEDLKRSKQVNQKEEDTAPVEEISFLDSSSHSVPHTIVE